jgi:hypothetical protein
VEDSLNFVPRRILAYCLTPNHWHHGSEKWVSKAVAQFGLENTMRNRGHPKKGS